MPFDEYGDSRVREIVVWSRRDIEFGRKLGEAQPGEILALIGDLRTGKTTLTKSIAEGLGVKKILQVRRSISSMNIIPDVCRCII